MSDSPWNGTKGQSNPPNLAPPIASSLSSPSSSANLRSEFQYSFNNNSSPALNSIHSNSSFSLKKGATKVFERDTTNEFKSGGVFNSKATGTHRASKLGRSDSVSKPSIRRREHASRPVDDDSDSQDSRPKIQAIETRSMNPLMVALTFLTSVCGFLFGYDTGYISGALVSIGTDLGTELTSKDKEYITSATSLGALIAACMAGILADQFGRKWVISLANVLFIAGAIIQVCAHSLWVMIGGRFVVGWGVGIASLVAPLYISEMAPSRFRGRLVVINVLAITGGQLVAYAISVGLVHVNNGWRILVGLSMIPASIQMVLFVFMPETPRYLVSRGKIDTARDVLLKTYKGSSSQEIEDKLDELVQFNVYEDDYLDTIGANTTIGVAEREDEDEEYPQGQEGLRNVDVYRNYRQNLTRKQRLRLWAKRTFTPFYEVLTVPAYLRAVIITCGLQGIQQFSGFNSLMYFSSTIFESVGFNDPTSVSLIVAGTNFLFTMVAFVAIDKIGRRRILVGSIWGMAVALAVNAIAFHFLKFSNEGGNLVGSPYNQSSAWSKIVIVAMLIYVAFYAVGIGNVPWQQSEMFPTRVRGAGTSFATAVNWAGSLVISSTFLTMLEKITPTGTFSLFAGLCALGELYVIVFYPETAGLSLEEVQDLLKDGFNIKKSVAWSKARMVEINEGLKQAESESD